MRALNVSELLDTFMAAGLSLRLTPESALKVTPAKALNDDLRTSIKANKAILVEYLQRTAAKDTTALRATDPDRLYLPHSPAISTAEIDAFTGRLATFTDRGLDMAAAEVLADKLVVRDREHDDRRLCIECIHLRGENFRSCSNWAASGMAKLSSDLVHQLQRCNGFTEYGLD